MSLVYGVEYAVEWGRVTQHGVRCRNIITRDTDDGVAEKSPANECGAKWTAELQMSNPSVEKQVLSGNQSRYSVSRAAINHLPVTPISASAKNLIREIVVRTRRNWVRELWDWAHCKRVALPTVPQLGESIAALASSDRDAGDRDTESPIFLLATGWRSGSTLLQRILVTDPRVLLWGEPIGEMAMLSGITEMLGRLATIRELKVYSANEAAFSSLATSWIATLYPPGENLRRGLRALLNGWLADPARERGFDRWGFKEVRLGAAEATLLHWLYPKAKFLLLSRNPYDCYRSLADAGWHHVYHSRPDIRVDSAAGLARHWNRIAMSWSELPSSFPAVRITYEDLVGGRIDFRKLESWLGIEIRESVALSVSVGGTARRRRVGLCHRLIISREAADGMRTLGYQR